jgi:hypothetical protein
MDFVTDRKAIEYLKSFPKRKKYLIIYINIIIINIFQS